MKLSHILVFVIVLIVIFGASKLPEIARNLGKSAKILKEEMRDLQGDGSVGTAAVTSESGQAAVPSAATGPSPNDARQVASGD